MIRKIFLKAAIGFGLFSAAVSCAASADPPLPPGGAAILMWTPEQQAWGYRNMEKIAPVRVFKRGKTVHPLPPGAQTDPSFSAAGTTYDTDSYLHAFRASAGLRTEKCRPLLE